LQAGGDQRRGRESEFVSAEQRSDDHVATGTNAAIDLHGNAPAQPVGNQRLWVSGFNLTRRVISLMCHGFHWQFSSPGPLSGLAGRGVSAGIGSPRYLRGSRSARRADVQPPGRGVLIQEIAVAIDVRREVEGVLPREPFGQLRVALLQRFDDLQ